MNFEMGQNEIIAFEQLRNSLVISPVLKFFNPTAVIEIHTDASMNGYGAVPSAACNRIHELGYNASGAKTSFI